MKFRKLTALLLSASMAVGLLAGCGGTPSNTETGTPSTGDPGTEATGSAASGESSLKGKRVRVVIGSTSTGGDSYMIADMVTRYLGEEMGFNGKVDAIGNAQALDTISKAKGDGTTIMMFHDMAFLSVLFGAVSEDYALENLTDVYTDCRFVDFCYPSIDPAYGGADWQSLRLVFQDQNDRWYLVGIVHGEWTI